MSDLQAAKAEYEHAVQFFRSLAKDGETTSAVVKWANECLETVGSLVAAYEAELLRRERCCLCAGSGYHGGAFGCFRDVDHLFISTEPLDHCHHDPSRWEGVE